MKQFELTVFGHRRIVFLVFSIPIILLTALLIGFTIDISILIIILPVLFLGLMGLGLFYFSVGHLTVVQREGKLEFTRANKAMFNYNDILLLKLIKSRPSLLTVGTFGMKKVGEKLHIVLTQSY